MRELKFRAWDKKKKKMGGISSIEFIAKSKELNLVEFSFVAIAVHNEGEFKITEQKYLFQYTGFKDRKGVEIYEGDIVKNLNPARSGEIQTIRDIKFLGDLLAVGKDLEVIGNIYNDTQKNLGN